MSSILNPTSAMIVVFSLLLMFITLSFAATPVFKEDIDNICYRSIDTEKCKKTLLQNPKARGANMYELCQISLDLVHSKAADSYNVFGWAAKMTPDLKLKTSFQACVDDYHLILSTIVDDAWTNFGKNDFQGINRNMELVNRKSIDCLYRFEKRPAELETRTEDMLYLYTIVMDVATYIILHRD